MRVSIQLKESTQPIEHEYVNTYQKGDFYVVYSRQTVHRNASASL